MMIIRGEELLASVHEDVDVCIVGSGAGGATVALELARRGKSVVVLEEGSAYTSKDFDGCIAHSTEKMYRNMGMDGTMGIPTVLLPTGKCLGGTTVINSGTCFRAPDAILKQWVDSGLTEYSPEAMAPYYDLVEEAMSVQPVKPEVMGRAGEIIAEGATRLGLHPKPLKRNVSDACKGCGNCPYGCTEDAKQSMIVKVIPEADQLGVKFYCNTKAEVILNDKVKALGVHGRIVDEKTGEFRHNVDISAKAVVVSCGALHTPAFLLRNKLANRSGQVGKNLKVHLAMRAVGVFDELIDGQHGVCQNMYIDDYLEQGIMLEATFTGPGTQIPGLPGAGKEFWELAKQYRHMASVGIMISEKSSGRVRSDGNGNPIVTFSISQEDAETLHRGMIISDRILFAAGAKRCINGSFHVPVVNSAMELDNLGRVKVKASDFLVMAFHPQGSCRMGVNPKKSVVSPTGETHDLKGLYLADGSIFPTSLGVNPQETIWAMVTKIAENIARNVSAA
jgi:choline dehydrogenase-like flavoprotein